MQLTASQTSASVKAPDNDQKYQDLLEYILSINIVTDPLDGLHLDANNNSSTINVDTAKKHLQTQLSLVEAELSSQASVLERVKSEHLRELEVLKVEKQSIMDTLERVTEQQRDVEVVNAKLRAELE